MFELVAVCPNKTQTIFVIYLLINTTIKHVKQTKSG